MPIQRSLPLLAGSFATALIVVTAASTLAQDVKKATARKTDHDRPSFDVLISPPPSTKKEKTQPAKPVAVVIAFADGTRQKVDISQYGLVTIEVEKRRVTLQRLGDSTGEIAPQKTGKMAVRVPFPKGSHRTVLP